MSQLLYSESNWSYVQRKYSTLVGAVIVTGFVIMVTVILALFPDGEGDPERVQMALIFVAFSFMWTVIVLLTVVLPSMTIQRFEIYSDRIALPEPRKRKLLARSPETIMKNEIEKAHFSLLERGGKFDFEIPGESDYGSRGEWRCALYLRNGETYMFTLVQMGCKEKCGLALRMFLKDIAEED
jgi:hypothetical protein